MSLSSLPGESSMRLFSLSTFSAVSGQPRTSVPLGPRFWDWNPGEPGDDFQIRIRCRGQSTLGMCFGANKDRICPACLYGAGYLSHRGIGLVDIWRVEQLDVCAISRSRPMRE